MSATTRAFWQTSTLVLGPTDRPISKWRRFRNKWRRRRGIIIFWSLIIGVLLYGFVIEPMRLVVRKTAIILPAWSGEFHVRFGVPPEVSVLTIK